MNSCQTQLFLPVKVSETKASWCIHFMLAEAKVNWCFSHKHLWISKVERLALWWCVCILAQLEEEEEGSDNHIRGCLKLFVALSSLDKAGNITDYLYWNGLDLIGSRMHFLLPQLSLLDPKVLLASRVQPGLFGPHVLKCMRIKSYAIFSRLIPD